MSQSERDKVRGVFMRDFAEQLALFEILGISIDNARLGDEKNPSVEVLEDMAFVPCDYRQGLRIHRDWTERVEHMLTERERAAEEELATEEKRKPRKVSPVELENGSVFYPVKGRREIQLRDRHGSVVDVANPICFVPNPEKTYDLVVAWSQPRGGRRHGRALPVFMDKLTEAEWTTPVERAPNSVEDVVFLPSFDQRGRRRGVEWAAIHDTGMRIVLADKYQPAQLGDPLRVALWVWRGMIHAAPAEAVRDDPSIASGEGLVAREGPEMADDEIIWQDRIVSVWDALAGYDPDIKPEIEGSALKKIKRSLLKAHHPDKFLNSVPVIQRAKEGVYKMLVLAFDKIEEIRGEKNLPEKEVQPAT